MGVAACETIPRFRLAVEAYDQMQAKLAPLRGSLQLLIEVVLSDLPTDARVLCVGAGTGSELIALAQRFPQ